MTTNRGPFVRLHLYARRTIMPAVLHDDSTTAAGPPSTDLPARGISRPVDRG